MCGGRALRPRHGNIITLENSLSPSPSPTIDSAGVQVTLVGCTEVRGRWGGRVFRSDDITALRSKCCEVLFRHTGKNILEYGKTVAFSFMPTWILYAPTKVAEELLIFSLKLMIDW